MNQLSIGKGEKECLDYCCGRLCGRDNLTEVITRLALVEGNILERLSNGNITTVHHLMKTIEWEPCVVSMALGALIRQGLIRCWEHGQEVFLEERSD